MSTLNNIPLQEKEAFPLLKIIVTIFCIIAIRMPLDKFAYQNTGDYFLPYERAVHASLYYFSVFLSLSILAYFLTKASFKNIFTVLTKIFLFILIVPLVDLIFHLAKTKPPIYLVIQMNDFLITFFKILNPFSGQGITFGQHIGAYAIFIALSIFVYKKTKKYFQIIDFNIFRICDSFF